MPLLKIALGLAGVGFLFYYGVIKLKEAKGGEALEPAAQAQMSVKKTVLTTMAFSLLNPHVYLDTVVLIGGYSTKFASLAERFYFGAGASLFSMLWFFGLVLAASKASRLLRRPKVMKGVNLLSGGILIFLAVKLGWEVFGWIKTL